MKEVNRVEHCTAGYTFLHDFALTPTHIVLIISPVALDPTLFLLGVDSAAASVKWLDGKPAEVHLLGRPTADASAAPLTAASPLRQQRGGAHSAVGRNQNGHQQLSLRTDKQQQLPQQLPQQQSRQQQQQQQQQQGEKRTRHQPEHLVLQVGKSTGSCWVAGRTKSIDNLLCIVLQTRCTCLSTHACDAHMCVMLHALQNNLLQLPSSILSQHWIPTIKNA